MFNFLVTQSLRNRLFVLAIAAIASSSMAVSR